MRETSIDYVAKDSYATYYSSDHVYIARMRKLMEQYPEDITVLMDDPEFGLHVRVPKSWFKEPRPPRRARAMTDEERCAAAERLRTARNQTKEAQEE